MIAGTLAALLLTTPPLVGQGAPDFTAIDVTGKTLKLSELVKKGPVILAFFPKAFTPG